MADRLIVHDLAAECRLGVHDWEQDKPQAVWIDLELDIDAAKAALRDDVHEAVDYSRLIAEVRRLAEGAPYRLMETLAEEVAALVLKQFGVPQVVVRVKKRAVAGIDHAAVEVVRGR